MYNSAKKSYLFKDKLLTEIPLILDNEVWKPFEKRRSRSFFGIDPESKVVLYGADNFLKNKRKGFEIFKKTINRISKNFNEKIQLILFGIDKIEIDKIKNEFETIKIHNLGKVSDQKHAKINLFMFRYCSNTEFNRSFWINCFRGNTLWCSLCCI